MWNFDYMRHNSMHSAGGYNSGLNQLVQISLFQQLGNSLANNFRQIGAALRGHTPPPDLYSGSFYPGVNFSYRDGYGGMGGMSPYGFTPGNQFGNDPELTQVQQLLQDRFNVAHIGNTWYAMPKNGNYVEQLRANSLDELMQNISEYEKTHRTNGNDNDGDAGRVRRPAAQVVDDGERVDDDGRVDNNDRRVNGGGVRRNGFGRLPNGYQYINYSALSAEQKGSFQNGMTTEQLVDKVVQLYKIDTSQITNLKALLEKANPNGIKDGKVADVNRLTIITKNLPNGKIRLPEGWYNPEDVDVRSRYQDMSRNNNFNASVLADRIINLHNSNIPKADLVAKLIEYNPRVFNRDAQGTLKSDISWDDLAIPNSIALKNLGATINTAGRSDGNGGVIFNASNKIVKGPNNATLIYYQGKKYTVYTAQSNNSNDPNRNMTRSINAFVNENGTGFSPTAAYSAGISRFVLASDDGKGPLQGAVLRWQRNPNSGNFRAVLLVPERDANGNVKYGRDKNTGKIFALRGVYNAQKLMTGEITL